MVKVREGQSIFDITTQQFGQIDNVVQVSSDNNISISESLAVNQELDIDPAGEGNNDIKKEIIEKGLSFNNEVVEVIPPVTFSDYFLPSRDTAKEMHDELYLFGVGGFTSANYWTSSESIAISAYVFSFALGLAVDFAKGLPFRVRACRSFTALVGAYSLRDVGPAGGLIFYISGTTYYEAAPSDQGINVSWSNITGVAVTGTGTAIGTGLANSNDIIAQPGHTTSAAKLCLDYES